MVNRSRDLFDNADKICTMILILFVPIDGRIADTTRRPASNLTAYPTTKIIHV